MAPGCCPGAAFMRSTLGRTAWLFVWSIMPDPGHSFRYEVVKTYRQRGPLQQYRLAVGTTFLCSRCVAA